MPKLNGDVRRFQQVLINLVKNAIKFTFGGQIDIRASYSFQDRSIIVQVKDTGVGILAEDFSKLFTKFGKLQRTASINNEGIGLGLMICKSIVDKSGGHIQVESLGHQ